MPTPDLPALAGGFDRIDHVAVAVRDADAALSYYTGTLGLPLVHDEEAAAPGVRLVYLAVGDGFVQLVQPLRDGPVAEFLDRNGEGLHHVCFAVEDVDDVRAHLPGEGEAAVFPGGRGRRCCFLRHEPNGLRIELTEHQPRATGGGWS